MNLVTSLALVLGSIAAGCISPPAVLEAPALAQEEARAKLSPPGEDVELALEDGTRLRGFFVEADPGAPVVLHLLESSGSVAGATGGVRHLAAQLADLGYSSLALDYSGVGLSSGERSCAHLERDALALWNEALRRAGGDPSRVHVRATSIGTLAAGTLLAHGVRPGGVSLILPVMPDTVVSRFARTFHGVPGQWVAWLLYDDVVELDLCATLASARVPLFALSSPDETFVDAEERASLRAAVESAGGTWRELPGGHLKLTAASRELFSDEARFLAAQVEPPAAARVERLLPTLPAEIAERFPPGSRERGQLERVLTRVHPARGETAAALALAGAEPFDAFLLARHLPRPCHTKVDFEELLALCDLGDPAGPLPLAVLDEFCLRLNAMTRQSMLILLEDGESLARSANADGGKRSYTVTLELAPGVSVQSGYSNGELWQRLSAEGLSRDETRRRFVRVGLKLYGIADRLRTDEHGAIVLEEHTAKGWERIDFAGPDNDVGLELHVRRADG